MFGKADEAVAGAVATRSAPRPRCRVCATRHGFEALPTRDSRPPSRSQVSEWPHQYWGPAGSASSAAPSGDGAIGDVTAPPSLAARSAGRCATPATLWRAGSKRADPLGGAAGVCGSASMRPAVDEAPCSQGQPLGVRSTSGRSIGGVRQAPSAFGILSRIQPQNQPAGLTVRVVAKHNRTVTDTGCNEYRFGSEAA